MRLSAIKRLHSNIEDTYFFLRLSLGIIAALLPLILWLGGRIILNIPAQTSISAYYHTDMRDFLVGALFALGLALLIYKGFSFAEDWLLNIAGILIICVAFFPMNPASVLKCFPPCDAQCISYSGILDRTAEGLIKAGIHGICALIFFIAIGCVCIFCSRRTLHLIPEQRIRRTYRIIYQILGAAMIIIPLLTASLLRLSPHSGIACEDRTIFWTETTGVWVFAVFWLLKTYEGHKYGADFKYRDRRSIPEALARAV